MVTAPLGPRPYSTSVACGSAPPSPMAGSVFGPSPHLTSSVRPSSRLGAFRANRDPVRAPVIGRTDGTRFAAFPGARC